MKFTYEIKGVILDMNDMNQIKQYYEVACTVEYLLENYDISDEQAWKVATEVREIMRDIDDPTEVETIEKVMRKDE